MNNQHHYSVSVSWTGNLGTGTSGYKDYGRNHEISAPGKPVIPGSSDPAFRGDVTRYNPEDMLVASLSTCHMLWYLNLASANKIVVLDYQDQASGVMEENPNGGGQFSEVTLRPVITITPGSDVEVAKHLHHEAHEKCFIARSVNFAVKCEPAFVRSN